MTYNIIEVANTHGGNLDYIYALLEEYSSFNNGFGIKFQPLKYDKIATKDYDYYDLYKSLFISKENWSKIIKIAARTKDVWLDIFDEYGVEVFKDNIERIEGIKLQASVLFNKSILTELSATGMETKKVIINVAAYSLAEIEERVNEINRLLRPCEVLIEVGFQSYPTLLSDSGLSKIKTIKEKLNNRIVFADHVDGKSEESIILPVIASLLGADIIEKHVMHSSLETKYDMFSSVVLKQYEKYIEMLSKYNSLLNQPFITPKEKEYLRKTIQVPIIKETVEKGSLISIDLLEFKRTNKTGIDIRKIEEQSRDFHILATNKSKGDTLHVEDFKKANIATIIACRLKSNRLKRKALLHIGDYSSIELCIKNALKFENINHTILATSKLEEDSELEKYTYREDVIFHQGDPDDVIRRYLDITNKLRIDVVVRITGDCPYISNEICQFLLNSHFKTGADYTAAEDFAVGTSVEIINVVALEKVKKYFPNADYSEYMTWYFKNNPEYFKINEVKLPEEWIRDYRLTLDYEEDLKLFREIESYFNANNLEYTLDNLFEFLDSNPEIAKINSHLTLKYKTDQELIETLNKETKMKLRK